MVAPRMGQGPKGSGNLGDCLRYSTRLALCKTRREWLLRIGMGMVVAFILIRALNSYGDPQRWDSDPGSVTASVMSFQSTTKYPPSLLYVLMTLGPAAIVCAFADRLHGPTRNALATLGRAPLAFYMAHLS